MPDTMMDPAFWIVVFILMGIIWLQQRLVRKDGFIGTDTTKSIGDQGQGCSDNAD